MFITFEGIECAGKDEQIKRLRSVLPDAIYVREPGSTEVGEAARDLIMRPDTDDTTRLFLFAAARATLTATVIAPALSDDKIIVCNRYSDSTIAYQMFGRSMPPELIAHVNKAATFGIDPDVTFYLNISIDTMFERMAQRKSNNELDKYSRPFYMRVKDGYDMLALMNRRIVEIDGTLPPDEMHKLIVIALEQRGVVCH